MADVSRFPAPSPISGTGSCEAPAAATDPSAVLPPRGRARPVAGRPRRRGQGGLRRLPGRSPQCAAHALAVREPYGVWGGLTEDEREAAIRLRRRLAVAAGPTLTGSPPEHERPLSP